MRARVLMRVFARLFRILSWPFVRVEMRGGAALDQNPNWIYSANHRSVYDFPLAVMGLAHFRRDARIMIAAEFWKVPAYAWVCRATDAIPVYRRSDPRGALSAAVAALESGDSTCIMPEGVLTWDPDDPLPMGPVKTGVARLAAESGTPVIPIALVGTERIWPKGHTFLQVVPRLRWRRPVICRVADEPLWLEGADPRVDADRVRAATEALVRRTTAELQAMDPTYLPGVDPHATPPGEPGDPGPGARAA